MAQNDALHELDSYRDAIRRAFEEGYAAHAAGLSTDGAWRISAAREREWAFAFTRMSVGAMFVRYRDSLPTN